MKIVFAAVLALICLLPAACRAENVDATRQVTIVSRDGKNHVFHVELALTPQQQAQGLMGRTEMAANAGMLFYFGKEDERSFWMKNTLIPLDMLFVAGDGRIIRIAQRAQPQSLEHITSMGPVVAVIELAGGESARLGIEPGARVLHPAVQASQRK